jgi:hypothetical protein
VKGAGLFRSLVACFENRSDLFWILRPKIASMDQPTASANKCILQIPSLEGWNAPSGAMQVIDLASGKVAEITQ